MPVVDFLPPVEVVPRRVELVHCATGSQLGRYDSRIHVLARSSLAQVPILEYGKTVEGKNI